MEPSAGAGVRDHRSKGRQLASTRRTGGGDSHGNPTLSSWPHIPTALSAPPNSILSLLQDEHRLGPALKERSQFPISALLLTSHLSDHGVQDQGSPCPGCPKSMDAQGPVPTEPHTHRATWTSSPLHQQLQFLPG